MTMAVQVSFPGVYIEEFAPGAPIQGVGTAVAAFIGPAGGGDLNDPTKITSWDQFKATFGDLPLPGFYLWYAVRGFFENSAQGVCYVVRASNGTYGILNLADRSGVAGNNVIRVRARQPGNAAIQVAVAGQNLIPSASTSLYRPTGTLTGPVVGRDVNLGAGQAANFRPGDWITIAALGERAQVARVTGNTLRIVNPLNNAYAAADPVRLADVPAGARVFRLATTAAIAPGALVPGTMLTITQGGNTDSQIVESVQNENLASPGAGIVATYTVTFRSGTRVPFSMAAAATVQSEEFNITVTLGTGSTLYANLAIDSAHPRYFATTINGDAGGLVRVNLIEPPPPVAPPQNLPVNMAATALAGGAVENLGGLTDAHYLTALEALRNVDDVNLVAIPDRTTAPVQQAMIAHCEQLMDRFAILDSRPGLAPFGAAGLEGQRMAVDSTRGYAGLYYPWLRVPPVGSGDPILVPPSGHVCGIISRSDNSRGVHKAPANEIVNGSVGVERTMSDIDQGLLNLQGINIIRVFQTGGRPMLYGARTTATDRNWQYVNIRRLFLFLEESIQEGIRWALFEPNNLQLWQKLKRSIGDFLTRAWRDGALFGAKAEDAFYVRIDEILNPFSEQQLGRLNIEIGVRPTYPAEFIVVRIGIWPGGAEVTEG
jgi:hypothetical protein